LVDALGETIDEVLVLPIVHKDMIGHACHHSGISVGTYGYPLGIIRRCSVGVLWINDYDLQPRCLARRM
jgi:hypothetical protein